MADLGVAAVIGFERVKRGLMVTGDTWVAGIWINGSDGRWKVRSLLLPWFAHKSRTKRVSMIHPRLKQPCMRTSREVRVWMPWFFVVFAENIRDEVVMPYPKTVPTFVPKSLL